MTEGVRYYFHVVNGRQYRDGVGKLLRTREEAIAHVSVLAREPAKDKGWIGFTISLTNGVGGMVAQIPVP
jgi:hypothetical protein